MKKIQDAARVFAEKHGLLESQRQLSNDWTAELDELNEAGKDFAEQHRLTPDAIDKLRVLLADAYHTGYEASMTDEMDPELSLHDGEVGQYSQSTRRES